MTPDAEPQDTAWKSLDRDSLKVSAILLLGVSILAGVPTTIGLASSFSVGFALSWVLPGAVALVCAGVFADYLRLRKTRYRVLPDAVELKKGILFYSQRRLARERIRTVDLTSHPVLRIFGLVRITLGTGEQGGGGSNTHTLVLEPIPRDLAEQLQSALLKEHNDTPTSAQRPATWQTKWIRYAPFSIATPVFLAVVVGGVFQIADWFGHGGLPVEIMQNLISAFGPWTVTIVGLLVLHVIAVMLAVGLHAELWWRHQLDRTSGGTLRVNRGLLTRRSLNLDQKRVRGVEMVEPLGIRCTGAARVQVVTTGLSTEAEPGAEITTLFPAAPRQLAVEIAQQIDGQTPDVELAPHPVAALTRRLRWALSIALTTALACTMLLLLISPPPVWVIATAVVLALFTTALIFRARDSANNLGHALTEQHLVIRRGSIRRSTLVLQRHGIIGWRVRQSIFQRRAGLATLIATTAAGRGHYPVLDADAHKVVILADTTVPKLLDPFLQGS